MYTEENNDFDYITPKCKICKKNWYWYEGQCYEGCTKVIKIWNSEIQQYKTVCIECYKNTE